MKTFRSLLAALLTVLLICTMSVSAFAAYNDVSSTNSNLTKIEFVDELGIIPSTWKGDFNPNASFTRADAVIAVYRMLYGCDIDPTLYNSENLGFLISDDKGDIEGSSLLASYLTWAEDNYLVTSNVEDSKFQPYEPITANEFMTLIAKVLRLVDDPKAVYPDDYVSKVSNLVGKIEAGYEPVTREQAAIALANALVTEEDGTLGEIGVYAEDDGTPLTSLAVKVFNMSSIDLVIRATKNNPLGYNVENGTLLSNGADVDLDTDLSDYVGYGINITYCDTDGSKTLTEDEEILAHSVSSTNTATVDLSMVNIASGNSISVDTDAGSFTFGTSTYMYLNGEPWPIGNDDYDLIKLIPTVSGVSNILNRPNLYFKCMQTGSSTTLATVFATETKPGKIVGINNGYYSVYDYYKAGTSEAIKHYYVSDCVFTNTVKVGDYVNFYESSGTCYFTPGTTITGAISSIESGIDIPTDYILADGTTIKEHAFFSYGDAPFDGKYVQIKDDSTGVTTTKYEFSNKQYVFVVADATEKYMLTWENIKTNYAPVVIKEIVTDSVAGIHTIKGTNLSTTDTVTFSVDFENTDSTTPLAVGDFIDYCDNGADAAGLITYVKKSDSITINARDYGDYFMNTETGDIYYKNQKYMGNKGTAVDFENGTVTLNLDMANTVVSIIAD